MMKLKIFAKLTLVGSLLLNSCASVPVKSSTQNYCSGYECVVPDDVFDAYEKIKNFYFGASAVCICKRFSTGLTKKERKKLANQLTELGYREQIDLLNPFTTNGMIVYPESLTRSKKFNKIKKHENVHRIMCDMSEEELRYLCEAQERMIRTYIGDEPLVKEVDNCFGVCKVSSLNCDEFYAYLLDGTLNKQEIMDYMKENFPTAYQIVKKIEQLSPSSP